jgi:hypothetical protein
LAGYVVVKEQCIQTRRTLAKGPSMNVGTGSLLSPAPDHLHVWSCAARSLGLVSGLASRSSRCILSPRPTRRAEFCCAATPAMRLGRACAANTGPVRTTRSSVVMQVHRDVQRRRTV